MPITLIGGYLGAGKTTLVNHLLRHADGLRLGVLVNDFGDLPIEADLVDSRQGDVIRLAGGCVCCQFGSDLFGALLRLARLPAGQRPDHLLLETSGVGLPDALARSLLLLPELRTDGVVVLADAGTLRSRAADPHVGETVLRQLQAADLVLLNKSDQLAAADRQTVLTWLAAHSRAPVVETMHAALPSDLVLGLRGGPRAADRADTGATNWQRPMRGRAGTFRHGVLQVPPGVIVALLVQALSRCPGLLRAKGFVQDVQGQVHHLQTMGRRAAWQPASTGDVGQLLYIGIRSQLRLADLSKAVRSAGSLESHRSGCPGEGLQSGVGLNLSGDMKD